MSFLTTTNQTGLSYTAKIEPPSRVVIDGDIQLIPCSSLKDWLDAQQSHHGRKKCECPLNCDTICYLSKKLNQRHDDYALIIHRHDISIDDIRMRIGNKHIGAVVDLVKLNYTRYINKYLEKINTLIPSRSLYIGCVETNCQRNQRLYDQCNKIFAGLCIFCEFFVHRILPKIGPFQKLYFGLTRGRYRFLTTAETLGRMVCCGFKIQEFSKIDNLTYYHVLKARAPFYDEQASYGPLIKLRRIGKHGRIFNVYKFRTMHPYSEYLQDYFVEHYGYNDCGKPANDFRIAFWGKFMRKYWLDEVPQLINLIKGEMKIVGVRPISIVRFSEFPKDLQELRVKCRTGCIPPYVALNMPSAKDNIEAERIYLNERAEHPMLTDLKYIAMAVYNIITNKIRSS